ncbi:pentachlorophenol monooxygenase [Crossiella equi]|uniref:Pentachlorophenol monooxygenase n=1 Tax=Crossiella equi TaxID=130796 RepID=A0ABS5A8T7_9PSEU|nr:FAD-dependent oxidoreductase [Crossiella equi]MBP2472135.1 pentachlorophenol monooxygenase [Crossiella equi]
MDVVDVVVVGAGPTGSTVAAELALAGRSVVVLDKRTEVSPHSRAFGVQARTLEALASRGLAEQLIGTGQASPGLMLWGGTTLSLQNLPSPFPFVLVTPQSCVDTLLEKHAVSAGAHVVRGAQVIGLTQHADHVEVLAHTPDGERRLRARYVVGADGAHSTVRTLLDVEFPGKALLNSIMLADVRLTAPPRTVITVNAVKDRFAFLAPFGDGWYRLITWDRRNEDVPDFQATEQAIRETLVAAHGTDHGLAEFRWVGKFRSDERQVAEYRHGRVFLAGDAAHIHSPAGGQGMNTGIQDGFNLGWKLAAVLDGADEAVLDTYQQERHPVGRLVLRSSGAMIRMITLRPAPARLFRRLVPPLLFRVPRLTAKVAGMFSGIALRYPGRGLVGTRAGDVPLRTGGLFAAQRDGGFVLVLATDAPEVTAPVRVVRRTDGGPSILVRPDGYIAWAGDGSWQEALAHWTEPGGF